MPEIPNLIPPVYKKLIQEHSSILKPDFKNVKHPIKHSIETGNNTPVRSKVRPLLPNSPKAKNGLKAWNQLIELEIVERVDSSEQNYWSSC